MFRSSKLRHLQLKKDLIVLQCDASRAIITHQAQQLQSPAFWVAEATKVAQRHPVLTAVLGVGAGLVAVQAVRHPLLSLGRVGALLKFAKAAPSVLKLISRLRGG